MAKENDITDLEKFMYDKIYDELNRSRDWPLKVMALASALYVTLIGVLKIDSDKVHLCYFYKAIITCVLVLFTLFTIVIIIKQHLSYLEYRNIQIRLQKKFNISTWKIDNREIFPSNYYTEFKNEGISNGWQGWLFYAFYIISIFLITMCFLWQ